MDAFLRNKLLFGDDYLNKLNGKNIAIFGLGGVGGHVVETLARAGFPELTLFDGDIIEETNLNRQIIALVSTIGNPKTEVMRNRIRDINPNCKVNVNQIFIDKNNIDNIDFTKFDYIVDAIDTITTKLMIIEIAKKLDIPIISCMGTGNKIDPMLLEITDISKTNYCHLAKVMRRELKKRSIYHLKVLSSKEQSKPINKHNSLKNGEYIIPSVSFVPNIAGILIGREVILSFLE